MKTILFAAAVAVLGTAAHAKIPTLNATCGDGTEVHADEGGPVYINGHEAKVEKINNEHYEAWHGSVTVSLTIGSRGAAEVYYTRRGSANRVCKIVHYHHNHHSGGGCPVDVSEADRYKYPACG